METLTIKSHAKLTSTKTAQVDFYITNTGLEDFAYHGQELDITKGIQKAIDDYLPIARQELLNVVNATFNGGYE